MTLPSKNVSWPFSGGGGFQCEAFGAAGGFSGPGSLLQPEVQSKREAVDSTQPTRKNERREAIIAGM